MKRPDPSLEELIAPCGLNCAMCSRFLSYVNNLERSQCPGCRQENKKCLYLFAKCSGINSSLKGNSTAKFCFECDLYPCKQINRLDDRYRKNFEMSVKDNLARINKIGVKQFTKEQCGRYRCSKCGSLVSVHNRKCFKCDTVRRLVEKDGRKY
jgi:hypothetical protein